MVGIGVGGTGDACTVIVACALGGACGGNTSTPGHGVKLAAGAV